MQVDGVKGLPILAQKLRTGGPLVLFRGSVAAGVANYVGSFPWFLTYNSLDARLPKAEAPYQKLLRSMALGFAASAVSDTCSNSIRVIKTVRQTAVERLSYAQVVQRVVSEEGLKGLFGRGLTTKIVTNGVQGMMFSVLWKIGQDVYTKKFG